MGEEKCDKMTEIIMKEKRRAPMEATLDWMMNKTKGLTAEKLAQDRIVKVKIGVEFCPSCSP